MTMQSKCELSEPNLGPGEFFLPLYRTPSTVAVMEMKNLNQQTTEDEKPAAVFPVRSFSMRAVANKFKKLNNGDPTDPDAVYKTVR